MTKADIIRNIVLKTGLSKSDVHKTIDLFMEEIRKSIEAEKPVYLRTFGTFNLKKRAAKIGQNIQKKTPISIPAHFVVAYKPAKEFATNIKNKIALKK